MIACIGWFPTAQIGAESVESMPLRGKPLQSLVRFLLQRFAHSYRNQSSQPTLQVAEKEFCDLLSS